ncbi:hypothetical protein [Niastella sp. OAS944]|uniref:hypothetical protein n=1 Tax=Niastella sp. OAS944 TaxID=2664089 RepID=UPI0034919F21|nr:hypothetical protein [Chitinophagaceae bacterium OAS944]
MKSTSNKKQSLLPVINESSSLRMVFKNEEVINETANGHVEEKVIAKPKLFVKEPLPLYNDYKFKYKDHDPL